MVGVKFAVDMDNHKIEYDKKYPDKYSICRESCLDKGSPKFTYIREKQLCFCDLKNKYVKIVL